MTAQTVRAPARVLPNTGSPINLGLLALATTMVAGGAALVAGSRRRAPR